MYTAYVQPDSYQAITRYDASRWTAEADRFLPIFVPMNNCGFVVDFCEKLLPELGTKFTV